MGKTAHQYAEVFPMMDTESAEWRGLVEDIKANGLNRPIVLLDGKVLDGRNRERACIAAGVEPRYVEFTRAEKKTNDPLTFVVSENLHRRHLSAGQFGWCVVNIEQIWKEMQSRASESRPGPRPKNGNENNAVTNSCPTLDRNSSAVREQLAERVGISKGTASAIVAVKNAADAGRAAPQVISAIERKTKPLSVEAARVLVTQPRDVQQKILRDVTSKSAGEIPVAAVKHAVAEYRRDEERRRVLADAARNPQTAPDVRLGDWRTALDGVRCDALIVDPPYSARTHESATTRADASDAAGLTPTYDGWTPEDVHEFVAAWSPRVDGWMVALTDSELIYAWRDAYRAAGRYAFAPVPCIIEGMSVRITGDGPSSWAVYAMVARPAALSRWNTLPGAYMGKREPGAGGGRGKPAWLMEALVADYSRQGHVVCDPMAGWGTTLVAAKKLGRRIIGGEIDADARAEALRRLAVKP